MVTVRFQSPDCKNSTDELEESLILIEEAELELTSMDTPDATRDGEHLLTPAMLAEVLAVSVRSIRRWHRAGLLKPAEIVMQLPHFDYTQIAIAKQLARWMKQGVSVQSMQQQIEQLQQRAGGETPFETLPIVAEGKRLVLRQGDNYVEAGGQLHFGFDISAKDESANPVCFKFPSARPEEPLDSNESSPATDPNHYNTGHYNPEQAPLTFEEMINQAIQAEDAEDLDTAVDWYRSALSGFGPNPDVCFQLAELLYRLGDMNGAKERYFVALELEPTLVEARANLGCVLAELGQTELAIAAFKGTLEQLETYADVHFHLARALDDVGLPTSAADHWQRFLELAPASPWADEAAERLAVGTPFLDF